MPFPRRWLNNGVVNTSATPLQLLNTKIWFLVVFDLFTSGEFQFKFSTQRTRLLYTDAMSFWLKFISAFSERSRQNSDKKSEVIGDNLVTNDVVGVENTRKLNRMSGGNFSSILKEAKNTFFESQVLCTKSATATAILSSEFSLLKSHN